MESTILFGTHISLWTADMLKGAIRQLFQEHYIIDRVRESETEVVLVVRLERFQRGLTEEDVGTITERFTDRGYVWYEAPRARVAGGFLAASRVHANLEPSANNGEAADAVMSGIVSEEELNMQDPQQQPSAQHARSCVICSDDDAPAAGLVQPSPDDESHVKVYLACYRSSLDAQNEEHVRNVELKAQSDKAQAQIDNLRNQNSTLDARAFLEVAHRQFFA
ncbi:hypothetical protein BOTCAL_0048g00080 [Botryotinia calthae]|uniref:Uncharacterized protein n=1 Tax=Botryotinia calthae TaxID=38488 RepID=A0A4Y8DBD1_9HELO|nr:hypothetical protein BOTCAL_0048g00080 [Botryotinia calthae]